MYDFISQLRKYQDSYTAIIIKPNMNYKIIKIHIVICFVYYELFDSGYFLFTKLIFYDPDSKRSVLYYKNTNTVILFKIISNVINNIKLLLLSS